MAAAPNIACHHHCGLLQETELLRTEVLQRVLRPAAVCHQLILLRTSALPYRMFALLNTETNSEDEARKILEIPACLRDRWSTDFLGRYDSVDRLLSVQAMHELHLVAETLLLVTYTTERIHSRHLRRAKDKQGEKPDLRYLGRTHAGWSAPTACPKRAVNSQLGVA